MRCALRAERIARLLTIGGRLWWPCGQRGSVFTSISWGLQAASVNMLQAEEAEAMSEEHFQRELQQAQEEERRERWARVCSA